MELAFISDLISRVKIFFANILASRKGHTVYQNLPYSSEPRHKLNIYCPKDQDLNFKPVIVFFHGGGWEAGSKDDYLFLAEPFVTEKFIVVIPDYGKYPEFKYPTFANDAALAISWVHQNIHNYQGNPNNIILIGHSAGAHIASLVATNQEFLSNLKFPREALSGLIGIAGAYDFIPVKKSYVEIFSAVAKNFKEAMPATYYQDPKLPVLLIHGDKDDVVEISNIISMQEQAKHHHLNLQVNFYNLDHIELIAVFSLPYRHRSTLVTDVIGFCKKQIKTC